MFLLISNPTYKVISFRRINKMASDINNRSPGPYHMRIFLFLKTFSFFDMLFFCFLNILPSL